MALQVFAIKFCASNCQEELRVDSLVMQGIVDGISSHQIHFNVLAINVAVHVASIVLTRLSHLG